MKRLYIALAIVFTVAVASQGTYTVDVVRSLQGGYPQKPFALGAPWPSVVWVDSAGYRAGLRAGDRVVSIDGRRPRGLRDLAQPLRARGTGDALPVVIERNGRQQAVSVKLNPANTATGPVIAVTVWLFTPCLCLALGFWVAALHPRDKRAWMMLGMLLGLSVLDRTGLLDSRGWPLPMGISAIFYREIAIRAWAACMALFGIYFPQRWSLDRRVPWIKWFFLVPLCATALWDGCKEAIQVADFPAAATLFPGSVPEWMQIVFLFSTTSIFFCALAAKYRDPALAADDRRRLRLLYWGCTASMTPSFLIWIFTALLFHRQPAYSIWTALSLAAMGLFPLTLAYVIVVHRAMDVRVVVRQGVQYALAQKGIRVIQAAFTVAVIFLVVNLADSSAASRPQKIALIAIGIAVVLRLRRAAESLRRWLDRRFFREAYNAEKILGDLSDQVRTILHRDELLETVVRKISQSLHVDRIAVLLQEGGIFRPALATGYPVPLDLAFPAESLGGTGMLAGTPSSIKGLEKLDAQLVLPLASRKELLGFISLGPKKSEEPYSPSDEDLLRSVAAQTGMALENSRLSEAIALEIAHRETLSREIEIAREVQQRLFPQSLPEIPALQYAGHCRPARGVGGDYYDFLALSAGRLGIAIGDVSGKGIPAALLMASLQASVRGQSQSGNVADLMTNVNRLVCDASPENRYATFFYAQFDPASRNLVYSNGGHNPPILLRGGDVPRLEAGGPPVGLFRLSRYEQAEILLLPGDLLILFTDGVSEAENPAKEEWGEDPLIAATRACAALPPVEIITGVMNAADRFAAGAPQHDDMTLVIARVLPA